MNNKLQTEVLSIQGWSEPFCLRDRIPTTTLNGLTYYSSKQYGVYVFINRITNELVYAGKSNFVGSRIGDHKRTHLSDAIYNYDNPSESQCTHAGRLLYKEEPDITNWLVRWFPCESEEAALQFENDIHVKLRPRFNGDKTYNKRTPKLPQSTVGKIVKNAKNKVTHSPFDQLRFKALIDLYVDVSDFDRAIKINEHFSRR